MYVKGATLVRDVAVFDRFFRVKAPPTTWFHRQVVFMSSRKFPLSCLPSSVRGSIGGGIWYLTQHLCIDKLLSPVLTMNLEFRCITFILMPHKSQSCYEIVTHPHHPLSMAPGFATSPFSIALITGASKGIGREIALRLADDGFDLTINSRHVDELDMVAQEIRKKGRRALCQVGDVSDEATVAGMVEKTVQEYGRLDVVCVFLHTTIPIKTLISPQDDCKRWRGSPGQGG